MALSGSFSTNVGSHWRVRCVWSGSQSLSGNYTDITMDVYWEATSSWGSTSTSVTKNGRSWIDGNQNNWTFSASLSGNQSKLVYTHTRRVNHDSDGQKRGVQLRAELDIQLTLSGVYYGTVTASDSVDLDRIPRASTMTTSRSWTAGSNRTVTLSTADNSFNHQVDVQVWNGSSWVNIKTLVYGSSVTSQSTSFDLAQNKAIFQALNGNATRDTRMIVRTYSGTTLIGTVTYSGTTGTTGGTVTAPEISTITASDFNIGNSVPFSISRNNGTFRHTVVFTFGNFSKTLTNQETSGSFTFLASEITTMFNQTPNSNELTATLTCSTFYDGVRVRTTTTTASPKGKVTNSNPTFTSSNISYADTNTTVTGKTLNNQHIVQNKSTLTAYVNTSATARNGASFSHYIISVAGKEERLNTATGNKSMGTINASTNQTLAITAFDSRGNSTRVTVSVTVFPYADPILNATAQRENSFGSTVTIQTNGSFSSVNGRNSITLLQYRYKERGSSTWILGWTNITRSTSGTTFTGTNITRTMDVVKLYDIEFQISDQFTSNKMTFVSVGAGQPIFFIDAVKRSLGFNDFPVGNDEFRVNGRIVFGANQYNSGGGAGESGGGAMFLNNSDITGCNGIYMNDVSDNNGEGIQFLKSGKPTASLDHRDYYTWRVDGSGLMVMEDAPMFRFNEATGATSWFIQDATGTSYEFLSTLAGGASHGIGIKMEAGGLIAIGSGESVDGTVTGLGYNGASEHLVLSSDNTIKIVANMQNGWSSRQVWDFQNNGDLVLPHANSIKFDQYGNVHALGNSITWSVLDRTGVRVLDVGTSGTNRGVTVANKLQCGNVFFNGTNTIQNDTSTLWLYAPSNQVSMQSRTHTWNIGEDTTGARVWSMAVYDRTYSQSANLYITSAGTLGRATSASKYKLNITPVVDEFEKVLLLDPKKWYDKASVEALSDELSKDEPDFVENDIPYLKQHFGLIAEDLVEAGLEQFVTYGEPNEDGVREVEGIEYDRVWTYLIPIVKKLTQRVTELETRLGNE